MIKYRMSWESDERKESIKSCDEDGWSGHAFVIERSPSQNDDESMFICLGEDGKIVLGDNPMQYIVEILSDVPIKFRLTPQEKKSSESKV